MHIHHYLHWRQNKIVKDGHLLLETSSEKPMDIAGEIYRDRKITYLKFFKMDILSRVAFLATELLDPDINAVDKEKIAVVLSTNSGCLAIDKKFDESRKSIASPALFVYTLPNIMLGEICIRNGFKGEQMCSIEDHFNAGWFELYVTDLLENRDTDACLYGHVEATHGSIEADLFWVTKGG